MSRFRDAFKAYYADEQRLIKASQVAGYEEVGATPYADLEFGETRGAEIACSFLDLRGFTKIALALEPLQTIRILQSVLVAANEHFRSFGGYVLDYTDGAMAVFEQELLADAVWDAVRASAFILADIRLVVNEDLKLSEDVTVRASTGLECGDVLWTRLGDNFCSQVKPISGVTFLAGKNSTGAHTDAWQALMGKRISALVPEEYKEPGEDYDFQFQKVEYAEPRWLLKWEEYLSDFTKDESSLRMKFTLGSAVTGARVSSVVAPRPARPLRDAPYGASHGVVGS